MDTKPRKIPTQARSRSLVDAIIESAARILQQEGMERLTTNHIAKVAGVGIASLYQYFPSKHAIVAALIRTQLDRDLVAIEALIQAHPLEPLSVKLHRFVVALCEYQASLAPLLAQLLPLLEPLEQAPVIQEWMDALTERFAALLQAHPEELSEELHSPDQILRAAQVVALATRAVLNNASMHSPHQLLDPDFQREVARLSHGLLRSTP